MLSYKSNNIYTRMDNREAQQSAEVMVKYKVHTNHK